MGCMVIPMAMIRFLLWLWVTLLWINFILSTEAYGKDGTQEVLSTAVAVTTIATLTSKKFYSWVRILK